MNVWEKEITELDMGHTMAFIMFYVYEMNEQIILETSYWKQKGNNGNGKFKC